MCVISEMSRWSERSDAPPEFSGDPMHPTGVASAVYFSYCVQQHLVYAKACQSAYGCSPQCTGDHIVDITKFIQGRISKHLSEQSENISSPQSYVKQNGNIFVSRVMCILVQEILVRLTSIVVVVLLCVVKHDVEGLMVIRLRRFLERISKQSADLRILSCKKGTGTNKFEVIEKRNR